jgi:hypothetical protein
MTTKIKKKNQATFGPRGGYQPGYGAVPPTPYDVTVDLNTCKITQASPKNITVSTPYVWANASLSSPITVSAATGTSWYHNTSATMKVGKVNITESDIEIDGLSLRQTLAKVNERLAIFQPNPELEADFEQLRQLRDQYVQLEQELMEKAKAWNALKNTDTK